MLGSGLGLHLCKQMAFFDGLLSTSTDFNTWNSITTAAIFCITALVLSFMLPFKRTKYRNLAKSGKRYKFITKNNNILLLLSLQMGLLFYSCMDLIFPVYAKDKYPVSIADGINMINAIVVILCQWPVAEKLSSRQKEYPSEFCSLL